MLKTQRSQQSIIASTVPKVFFVKKSDRFFLLKTLKALKSIDLGVLVKKT